MASGYGTVQSIEVVQKQGSGMGLGTAAGAVVGGLLGNQVGSGSGRTAATVAGAAGGALAGNTIERNRAGASQAYQVTLRMDNGAVQTLMQDSAPNLQVGDRVRIVNGAIVERIVR
jgi:outer membrane lipoprotein SlyB